jgi:hypothetical protein
VEIENNLENENNNNASLHLKVFCNAIEDEIDEYRYIN